MGNVRIKDLIELTTAADADFMVLDRTAGTRKISVENFLAPINDLIDGAIEPVAEWNGANTTQIDGTDAFVSTSHSIAVSRETETTHPKGGYLRFLGASGGNTTGTRAAVRLVTAPLPVAAAYLFEVAVRTPGATSTYGGISVYGDLSGGAGHYFGYNYLFGGSGWKSRVDDNVLVSDGSTGDFLVESATAGLVRVWVRGDKVGGAPPKFRLHGQGIRGNTTMRGSMLKQSQYATEPAPSSWHSLTCLRWGFCLQAGGGTSLGTMDIDDYRVYAVR